jgi:hypothetical protein
VVSDQADCDCVQGTEEPYCTPDVTPPGEPVITTNGGANFSTSSSSVSIQGTTDADTDEMYSKVNSGAYGLMPGYSAGNTNWMQNFTIAAGQTNTYCFAAEDWSNNMSAEDCITVNRLYPAPSVHDLVVDCSGGPVPGSCVAGGFPYPATFIGENSTSCSASATKGSTSAVNLNGNAGSFTYITGPSGEYVTVTATCNGPGGSDNDSTQIELQ